MLHRCQQTNQKYISLDDDALGQNEEEVEISGLLDALARTASEQKNKVWPEKTESGTTEQSLPKVITFPYARHSSYSELCHLVKVFNPNDIHPCTVDEENWHEGKLCITCSKSPVVLFLLI